MVVMLLLVTGATAYLGAAVVARHRAQAAADLAAVAAAAQLPQGYESACNVATLVAREMLVGETGCTVEGLDVLITVQVAVGSFGVARAVARAGPVGVAAVA